MRRCPVVAEGADPGVLDSSMSNPGVGAPGYNLNREYARPGGLYWERKITS